MTQATHQLPVDVQSALHQVNEAAGRLSKLQSHNKADTRSIEGGELREANYDLYLKASRLVQAVQGPLETLSAHNYQLALLGALSALLEIGVFDKLPSDGTPRKAKDLAEQLNVDKELLVRLMRATTVLGPFAETGPEEYAHTPYSLVYNNRELRSSFKVAATEFGPTMTKLSAFYRENGFTSESLSKKLSDSHNVYTFTHQTNGTPFWAFISNDPKRQRIFDEDMMAEESAVEWTISLYPFNSELRKYQEGEDVDPDQVLVVDIAGGKGQATKKIRDLLKTHKGRLFLEDRLAVLEKIEEQLTGIETLEVDIFKPQPVRGALVYYLRRVLHDWNDEDCVRILQNIAASMSAVKSRILISEQIISETNAHLQAVCYDIQMLTFNGKERTEQQWKTLVENAGLRLEKIHRAPGSAFGVIEAWLK